MKSSLYALCGLPFLLGAPAYAGSASATFTVSVTVLPSQPTQNLFYHVNTAQATQVPLNSVQQHGSHLLPVSYGISGGACILKTGSVPRTPDGPSSIEVTLNCDTIGLPPEKALTIKTYK